MLKHTNTHHGCGECSTIDNYGYFLDGNFTCYDCYQKELSVGDDDYDPDHESHSEGENNEEK